MESCTAARERAGWLGRFLEKIAQLRLRLVRLGYLGLYKIGKQLSDPSRERCSVVPPAPHSHFGNAKRPRCRCVAAKGYFEREVMSPAGETAFEARWRY